MARQWRYFAADFETTVYDGQERTDVWSAAITELGAETVNVYHTIRDFWEYVKRLGNCIIYFHNLKFDGTFLLNFFLLKAGFKQALHKTGDGEFDVAFKDPYKLDGGEISYCISDRGRWYNIKLCYCHHIIEFRDSLKLLPFSLAIVGDSFKTKHRKLNMKYEGLRYPGCEITDAEMEYIENDVHVLREALQIMYEEGHNKLTIGSCCMSEYKTILKTTTAYEWDELFPNIYELPTDNRHGAETAGDYVRKAYRGAWTYLVKGAENKVYHHGTTADVNSLYPSMMHSDSGNYYPIGKPCFWEGDYIPEQARGKERFYFVRIRTNFDLKDGMLPFIQIKNSPFYRGTEMLETSKFRDPRTGEYFSEGQICGKVFTSRVEMTLTMMDYELLQKHYTLTNFEIIDGCWFYAMAGIFDAYIDKYAQIKMTTSGARKTLAKLYLNNLYGKFASSTDSSFKVAYEKEPGVLGYMPVSEHDKTPGYIPVGAAITSYARRFTITAAQKNFHGADKPGFKYADTDSIHCDLSPDQIVGIRVHPTEFCAWKLESCWSAAKFVRQKTYMEFVTHEDMEPIEHPHWEITCAGMPKTCKDLFLMSTRNIKITKEQYEEMKDEHKKFVDKQRTVDDFGIGLRVPGKLMPKQIPGGTLLVEGYYEMRGR